VLPFEAGGTPGDFVPSPDQTRRSTGTWRLDQATPPWRKVRLHSWNPEMLRALKMDMAAMVPCVSVYMQSSWYFEFARIAKQKRFCRERCT
jgi:hypothetical protein